MVFTPTKDDAYCNESNSAAILGVVGSFLGAATIAVGLRVYVRSFMVKFFGADDYVMLAALLMAIGTFICFVGETNYGQGKHTGCVSLADMQHLLEWQFYHSLWNTFGLILVKISIAFFLIRLAPRPRWKWPLWGAIIFLVCFAIASAGTIVFDCTPIDAAWTFSLKALPSTRCFSNKTYAAIGVFNSVINILTDVLFAVLPIPIIIRLQVNLRTKFILAVILSLGFVACAAGMVKTHLQFKFLEEKDWLWRDDFMVWGMLELCLGIMAGSLASLKPLLSKMLATAKTVLGMSGSHSSPQMPNNRRENSQVSGYRRQYDPHNLHDMLAGVQLEDYEKGVNISVESRTEPSVTKEVTPLSKLKRVYEAHITSGDVGHSQERSWDDENSAGITRSESEERLHPTLGIFRTREISSTTEVIRR
ncbi:hypothetical protein LTR08_001935 [Meristemomyces frigidus]|nr:hypothetical protein LTR08_001935 [Meristemomyces frigidus]